MKLLDLLVKELPKLGGWPDGVKEVEQDTDGSIFEMDSYYISNFRFKKTEDWRTAAVTKSQYEAAIAASEGWIEWGGGECPVDECAMVDYKVRSGDEVRSCNAHYLRWRHDSDWQSDDIIAYRLHKPDINPRSNNDRLEQDLNECIGQDVDIPELNGDGVPPIGCACEMQDSKGTWLPVDIIAKNDGFTFGWSYDYRLVFFGDKADEFRPLRTEEEKALESAKHIIAELCRDSASNGHSADLIMEAIAAGKIPGVKLENK